MTRIDLKLQMYHVMKPDTCHETRQDTCSSPELVLINQIKDYDYDLKILIIVSVVCVSVGGGGGRCEWGRGRGRGREGGGRHGTGYNFG